MIKFKTSIRRHLLGWLLVPILSLCSLGAVVTYAVAVQFAAEAYDNGLVETAHSVNSRIALIDGQPRVDLPPAALAILRHSEKDSLFYQVLSADSQLLSGDAYIPSPDPDEDYREEPVAYDGVIENLPVRIVILMATVPHNPNTKVIIKVAETTAGRGELIQNILLAVLLPQLLLIALAAAAVWFGVKRGLQPLQLLAGAVSSRSPSDLGRLSEQEAPSEVKPLVRAINNLLAQVEEDREAQRRFVANAAHQLRTPLAGLKTQAELAVRLVDPVELKHSLRQMTLSVDRASRLAQQLLSLARLEPAASGNRKRELVDLVKVARDATGELVPQALSRQIDLGFETVLQTAFVWGDVVLLHEMCVNLIENAVIYTQVGGKVTVQVAKMQRFILSVEDNGPGIPELEREKVFERFYRVLGNKMDGSGLGLAIVREIAEVHQCQVELHSGEGGCGALVMASFPEPDSSLSLPVQLADTVKV